MKVPKNTIRFVFILALFILAVVFSEDVVNGARKGVELSIGVVIPSIFPLLLLSQLLCNPSYFNGLRILNPLCRFVHAPTSASSILLLAMLGGYPVGAQAIAAAFQHKQLTLNQARRMLGFCNNAGPAFIFGLLGSFFTNKFAPVLLWIIHIGSALIVGHMLPCTPANEKEIAVKHREQKVPIMRNAIITMGVICGWITLFRTLLFIVQPLFFSKFPETLHPIIFGAIELTNGCVLLPMLSSEYDRFVFASAMLGIGGLCVALQTGTITSELGMGKYFPGKIMQTCICAAIACCVGSFLYGTPIKIAPIILCLFVLIVTHFILKKQNNSSIMVHTVV